MLASAAHVLPMMRRLRPMLPIGCRARGAMIFISAASCPPEHIIGDGAAHLRRMLYGRLVPLPVFSAFPFHARSLAIFLAAPARAIPAASLYAFYAEAAQRRATAPSPQYAHGAIIAIINARLTLLMAQEVAGMADTRASSLRSRYRRRFLQLMACDEATRHISAISIDVE